jgi:UDP-glucose 4-epimerase
VIHAAAIPEPTRNPPHTVFRNNLMATFNVVEAAVRFGARRVVHLSSETVPGFLFAEREWIAEYAPVDEEHPVRPQDPYALAKHFGEQLMDAATRRSDVTGVSIRPTWVGDAVGIRPHDREDASGTSIAKARALLGYDPQRSWRDYLTEDGTLRPEAAERLECGETGVQRGRALTG